MQIDIAIIGAGAAGLMAGIWAGREAREQSRPLRIVAFDGGAKIGVKILVAGGGRCNVTHHAVSHSDFAGGSKNAIRSVLRRFDVPQTVEFFKALGVSLKREATGKLFPTTDNARTVLDALLRAAHEVDVEIRHPARIDAVERDGDAFVVSGAWGSVRADRLILATGGKALPRSGSDGAGYTFARELGHTVTPRVFPALVPLILEETCVLRSLSGIAVDARIELRSSTGKRLTSFTDSVLCTHFGLSGPAPMNVSRFLTAARFDDPGAHLVISWLPELDRDAADQTLRDLGKRSIARWLRDHVPERLAVALCDGAGVERATTGAELKKDERRALLDAVFEFELPVIGDRGFRHAEVTAGGVPLEEITVSTMASKRSPGLFLCGEICDVDGRIGGFNFQWAWASGVIAGSTAVRDLLAARQVAMPSERTS